MKKSIVLTFDVEDWFQVENFKEYIDFSTWNSFELRVEKSTLKILDVLEKFPFKPKATFFILGWIAKKLPGLVREIDNRGHEIASHGDKHHLCTGMNDSDLFNDLISSRKRLEDITGRAVIGYRAPSFALTDHILKIIRQAGYRYDSSYNSFSAHGRYGTIDLSTASMRGGVYKISEDFYELPVSNLTLKQTIIPFGGGGYFRLYPLFLFRWGIRSILKKDKYFLFYAHPWEFDPDQPRVDQASSGFKFRHYVNLNKTETKFKKMIEAFQDQNIITCKDHLSTQFKTIL